MVIGTSDSSNLVTLNAVGGPTLIGSLLRPLRKVAGMTWGGGSSSSGGGKPPGGHCVARTFIVQSFCNAGTLLDVVLGLRAVAPPPASQFVLNLLALLEGGADGMAYTHAQKVVHGDLNVSGKGFWFGALLEGLIAKQCQGLGPLLNGQQGCPQIWVVPKLLRAPVNCFRCRQAPNPAASCRGRARSHAL